MKKMLFVLILSFSSLLWAALPAPVPLGQFLNTPKLVVVLVIDQFRSDFLIRLQDRFQKEGKDGQVGGFLYLMNNGAYFPFAQYEVMQAMTCPGHAQILTGATADVNGIPLNEWYDRKAGKMTYCAEDAEFGISPRRLKTTTVADEMRVVGRAGKVLSLSLKDRSAVMMGGQHPTTAVWMSSDSSKWETSSYYGKQLPNWVEALNKDLKKDLNSPYVWKTARFEKEFSRGNKLSLTSPYGTEILVKLASEAVVQEKLGRGEKTDFLLVSFSNHDFLGHRTGPLAPEIEELTLVEDQQISKLLTLIKSEMKSMKDVLIVLTADHGVSPKVEDLQEMKIDAGKIDDQELTERVNTTLNKRYGVPANKKWIAATRSFNFYLSAETLKQKKLASEKIQEEVRQILLQQYGVWKVFTASDYQKGLFPPGQLGEQIKSQYVSGISGDLIIIPRPYYMEKEGLMTTHMTGFSYDRQVPLILVGSQFRSGVYSHPARMTDLAPTLAFALGVTAPSGSVGQPLPIFK